MARLFCDYQEDEGGWLHFAAAIALGGRVEVGGWQKNGVGF